MNWSRTHTTVAGVGLILAVNAFALIGVAYNRSAEPESVLRLSERELRRPPQDWGFERENSGLALRMQWRVTSRRETRDETHHAHYDRWGDPVWLGRAKLAELGIEVPPVADERSKRRYEKLMSKEVLLVLELDGEQYRAALAEARARAERLQARFAASPRDTHLKDQAENATKQLEFERSASSRLFAIDAGLDRGALRAKYPDRARYAIVNGRIEPRIVSVAQGSEFGAHIEAVDIDRINVPLEMRAVFDGAATEYGAEVPAVRFEAIVAHGRRLEPWLVAASRKTP